MKKQGFGKDDIQPTSSTEQDILIDTEKADAIILEVLLGVGSQIAGQAGLEVDREEDDSEEDFLNKLLAALQTVGVELELIPLEVGEDGRALMDVKVKQTVGTIDLSDAVTKKEDK